MRAPGFRRGGPVALAAAGPSCVGASGLAVLLVAATLLVAVPGCRGEPELDEELRGIVELDRGATLHTVVLSGRGSAGGPEPATLRVSPGDAVQIVTGDRRPHAIRFGPDGLTATARRFLAERGQLASPPLVEEGTRFIVSFTDAPPGVYPFRCLNHEETSRGRIVVTEE